MILTDKQTYTAIWQEYTGKDRLEPDSIVSDSQNLGLEVVILATIIAYDAFEGYPLPPWFKLALAEFDGKFSATYHKEASGYTVTRVEGFMETWLDLSALVDATY